MNTVISCYFSTHIIVKYNNIISTIIIIDIDSKHIRSNLHMELLVVFLACLFIVWMLFITLKRIAARHQSQKRRLNDDSKADIAGTNDGFDDGLFIGLLLGDMLNDDSSNDGAVDSDAGVSDIGTDSGGDFGGDDVF